MFPWDNDTALITPLNVCIKCTKEKVYIHNRRQGTEGKEREAVVAPGWGGWEVEHGPHFGKMAPSWENRFHWRTVMGTIKYEVPNNSKLPDDFDFALK